MMDKKGQGISITVIIIAAIALVVLVILIVMFVGRIGIFGQKVETTTESATRCAQTCFANTDGYRVYGRVMGECPAGIMHGATGVYSDVSAGQVCCIDDTIDADEC
jgi:hypothetical protein